MEQTPISPIFGKEPQREIQALELEIQKLKTERTSITDLRGSDASAANYDQHILDVIDRNIAIAEKRKKSLIEGTPNQH